MSNFSSDEYRGLLSGSGLENALKANLIFAADTWSPRRLRAAAYDLTIARDLCVVPSTMAGGSREHRAWKRGESGPFAFTLLPGESAFVSTVERVQLDWSISGQVGPKFSMSARGLLVMTGLCIDPGFGLIEADGYWIPAEDQRIHFVLANIGPDPIQIASGHDSIASVQFFVVEPVCPERRLEVPSRGLEYVEDTFFQTNASPVLAYFRSITDLKQEVADLRRVVATSEKKVDVSLQGVNTVVLFGVYLLAVTILGVVFATTGDFASKLLLSASPVAMWTGVGFCGGLLVLLAALTYRVVRVLSLR